MAAELMVVPSQVMAPVTPMGVMSPPATGVDGSSVVKVGGALLAAGAVVGGGEYLRRRYKRDMEAKANAAALQAETTELKKGLLELANLTQGRLEAIEGVVKTHGEVLAEHGESLKAHSESLQVHSESLKAQDVKLAELDAKLIAYAAKPEANATQTPDGNRKVGVKVR